MLARNLQDCLPEANSWSSWPRWQSNSRCKGYSRGTNRKCRECAQAMLSAVGRADPHTWKFGQRVRVNIHVQWRDTVALALPKSVLSTLFHLVCAFLYTSKFSWTCREESMLICVKMWAFTSSRSILRLNLPVFHREISDLIIFWLLTVTHSFLQTKSISCLYSDCLCLTLMIKGFLAWTWV